MATYGRTLDGSPDVLAGFQLEPVTIDDPDVVRVSGKAVHSIARETGDPADRIAGLVFELSEAELASTDAYEGGRYARVEVPLESGTKAFVYVTPDGPAQPLSS